MKRALPLLLAYIAVVVIACLLAFVVSQSTASAQVLAQSSKSTAANDTTKYVLPGIYKTESSLATWRDASRQREVPVKLYFPDTNPVRPEMADGVKFPVILFSHGLGGNREAGKRWAEHWASHGFVVVSMQHGGSDEALWKGAAPRDIPDKMKAGMTISNLGLRVGDVHFLIDEIIRRSDAREIAFVNADPKRIGMSGHSFGAQTTLAVVGQKAPTLGGQSGLDARIIAAIAFSPNARNKSNPTRQFGDIKLPFFSVTGSEDASILGDGTKAKDRRLPFENMPTGQKYLAVFDGGDHAIFGGSEFRQRRPSKALDASIQSGVMAGTLAFWSAYLRQDEAAREWLNRIEQGGFKATLGAKDIFELK